MAGIHVGSPVIINLHGGDSASQTAAVVTAVFPAASSQTRTDIVEAVIPNPGDKILPGAFASLKITKASMPNRLLVPSSSVIKQGGQAYVWTAQGPKTATQMYECVICHIHYTAAQAKQYGYRDPMEGGKLVPVAASAPSPTSNWPEGPRSSGNNRCKRRQLDRNPVRQRWRQVI